MITMPTNRLTTKLAKNFALRLWLTVTVFIVVVFSFSLYVWSEKQIDKANATRQISLNLVDELRYSSDDLSNMARAYVVSADQMYKQRYFEILDIREGKKPRTTDYNYVDWNQVKHPHSLHPIPLMSLIEKVGFSDEELNKLIIAKSKSDALVKVELAAITQVEQLPKSGIAQRSNVIQKLFDSEYLVAKTQITSAINDSIRLMDHRTAQVVAKREMYATYFRVLFVALSLLLLFLLLGSYKELLHILGAGLDQLHDEIEKIGRGDFNTPADTLSIRKDSVMGMLLQMQSSLRALNDKNRSISKKMSEQDEHLRLLLATIPDLIWLKDINGVYVLCNPMFERFFGAKESEIVGKTDYDFVDKSLADLFRHNDQRAIDELKAVINEEEVRFADDGHVAYLETIKTPIIDNDGHVLGVLGIARDITERKANEIRVKRLSDLYNALSQCNEAIMRCKDSKELFPWICKDAVELGHMKMAWIGLLDSARQCIVPVASYGDGVEYLNGLQISFESGNKLAQGPSGLAAINGQAVWCQDYLNDPMTAPWRTRGLKYGWRASAALPLLQEGKVVGIFTLYAGEAHAFDESQRNLLLEMSIDISFALDKFSAEQHKKESEAQLKLAAEVFRSSSEGFMITDASYNLIMINNAFTKITGFSEEEAIGKNPNILSSGVQDSSFYSTMWSRINLEGTWRGEVWNRRKSGEIYPEWLSISVVRDAQDQVTHYIGIFTDISQQKHSEARINRLAHFDELTGLPNRAQLAEYINKAIHHARRKNSCFSIMFLDLDHFKNVNDSLGHQVGDRLLIRLGELLRFNLRSEDIVTRFGGDEFILLLNDTDANAATHMAQKILASIAAPISVDPYVLVTTASIGIAMFPYDGQDMNALFKCADTAMYKAKQSGRNNYCFFTQEMQLRSDRTLKLENALRNAIANNELMVHYQPQLSGVTGKVIGAEALVRWMHPEFGIVSPAEFIPIAEGVGLILKIGEWVLRQALTDLKLWVAYGLDQLTVAVNISAVQFNQPDFVTMVMDNLRQVGVAPEFLELELTESVAMDDAVTAVNIMNNLHDKGIRMSIDDFGTGYSSLSKLKKFNVYKLKIDQSFVRDICVDNEDKAIVLGIINLAHSLGLKTIAEGVENQDQLDFLVENGCQEIQGYLYSKPVPSGDFIEYALSKNA